MPDITIAGATFRNVPQIDVPKDGGGSASFVYEEGTKQISTNGTHDVSGYLNAQVSVPSQSPVINPLSVTENGTYTAPSGVDGYSPVTVNVSGGGGASNIVTGTFMGTTAGTAMDVTLNYSGNGYPVAVLISPTEGSYNSNTGSFYNLMQRYAAGNYCATKNAMDTSPTYDGTGDNNRYAVFRSYKGSASNPASQTAVGAAGANAIYLADNNDASENSGGVDIVKIRSKTKLSVFIANTTYGFAANIEYTYRVIYSS